MGFTRRFASVLGAGILMIGAPMVVLADQMPAAPVVQQEGQGTYENMIAALGNLGAEIEQLNAITEMSVTDVRLFDAEYLASGQDRTALDQAVAMHGAEIQQVQSTLANHELVRAVLDAVAIPVEKVVALDTRDTGDVVLYYRP